MFGIQPQELLVILVVALIVVGPKKLPELGRSLGKGLRELRKAQDEVRKTVQVNLDEEERPSATRRARGASAPLPRESGDDPPAPGSATDAAGGATAGAATVSEVSKTLGRGLGELRRARQEVERTFRVDLNETPVSEPGVGDASDEGARPD